MWRTVLVFCVAGLLTPLLNIVWVVYLSSLLPPLKETIYIWVLMILWPGSIFLDAHIGPKIMRDIYIDVAGAWAANIPFYALAGFLFYLIRR